MSAAPFPPKASHSSSIDSAKVVDAISAVGQPSAEIYDQDDDYYPPNNWAKIREIIREPAAEMLGTMILTLVGCGANCQAVLSANTGVASSPKGDALSASLGWACGIALAVWVSQGVTGGHVNPVVTLSMAVFRDLPWWKVPGYLLGQLIGAWAGAIIAFGNYFHAIDIVEGKKGRRTLTTASLFGTYALEYMSSANCFFDEFIGTFILLLLIFAITDKKNSPPPGWLVPLVLFFTILGVGVGFGMQTGGAVNPARDLGPRLMTAMVGYGRKVFDYRSQYWIWSPLLGSICGGLSAAFVYSAFIYRGSDSFINAPNAAFRRQKNVYRNSGPHA